MDLLESHAEALARELRIRLRESRRAAAARGDAAEKDIGDAVAELVAAEAAVLSPERRAQLTELVLRDTVGLGPLEGLLADPDVEDVLVNGPDDV